MKKVIVILVLLVVVTAVGVLGYWHWRRGQGRRLLIRADVALRADQPGKALKLASRYTVQRPGDWQGHRLVGQANLRLGDTDAAEVSLKRAVELAGDEPLPRLLLAGCYSHRATRLLSAHAEVPVEAEVRRAIEQYRKANEALQVDPNGPTELELAEQQGLNLEHVGNAYLTLSEQFRTQARQATAARADTRGEKLLQDARSARHQADQAFARAVDVLMAVCRRQPARSEAALSLVRLTARPELLHHRNDVRAILLNADSKPPVATAMLVLADLSTDGETDAHAITPEQAVGILDELLAIAPDASEVVLARAQLALSTGEPDRARQLAERVLKKNSAHAGAGMMQARALMAMGLEQEAEKKLHALKSSHQGWAEAYYLYAEAARAVGKDELAFEAMRAVTRLDPGHGPAREFLARNLLEKGFEKQALLDARNWYQAQPDSPRAVRMYALALQANDRRRQAADILETARTQHADQAGMLLAVAEAFERLGRNERAQQVAQQAAALQADSWAEQLAIARAAVRAGQRSRADSLIASLLDSQGHRPRVRFTAAKLYAMMGRKMQALEQARKAVSLRPAANGYRLLLARLLMDTGQVARAYQRCREILASHGDHAEAAVLARQAAILLGRDTEDLPPVPASSEQLPLALTYLRRGRGQKAAELARRQLAENPSSVTALSVLAEAQLASDRRLEALATYRKVLAAGGADLSAYVRIAQILASDADVADVEKSMLALPGANRSLVHLATGRLHLLGGDYRQAADALEKIRSDPDAEEYLRFRAGLLRARALAMASDGAGALQQLDALAQGPGREVALLAKISLLRSMGRNAQAEAILAGLRRQAIEDKDTALLSRLVRLEAQQGNRRSALDMSTVLAGLTRDAWAGHAELLRAAGKLDQAETWYRRAIAARPGELATPLRLADLLAQRQRFPEVLDVLRELATRSVTGRLTSLRERARYFASWGLPAEALRCIEELDKLSAVAHPAVQVSQARAYASLGEADRARRIARAIPKHSPLHRRARQMLASLAEDPAERKAILAELAREHPGDPSIALQRMGVLQERNEHQQAAEVFLALRKRTGQAALPPAVLEMGLQALVDARRRQEAAELAAEAARASGQVHWRLRATLLGGATSAMPEPKQPHAKLLTYAIEMVRADKKVRPDELASARKKLVDLAERLQTANESPRIRWMVLLADVAAGEVIEARRLLDAGFAGAPALREAAEELVALAEKSPSARREAARAMESAVADRLGMANLAERIADETLTDRPGAQWAAATIVSTNPKRRKDVLDTLEPEGTTLAKLIEADRMQEEGAFARSAERYREMLEDRPGDWALQQRLAMALERCDQQAQALALYETVWSASKSPAAANNAAYLVSQLHAEDPRQLARAMERVDHAIGQVGRAPSLLDTKGWLMHLRNDNEKAAYLLREAISQARDSAEIHYHLAVVEEALGNGSLAAMHYRSAVELVAAARREGRVVQPGDAKAAERARRALDARKEAA